MRSLSSVCGIVAVMVAAGCAESTGPSFFTFQSSVNDARLPDSLKAVYREDAALLALRHLLAGGYDRIEIPADQIRTFYDALVLVYNVVGSPARDSVVDLYHIHPFPMPATHELMLWINAGTSWADPWARGERFTGNADVDRLLTTYDLTPVRYRALYEGDALVVLSSSNPLNVAALAPLFAGFSGVRYSEPDGAGGDGNDVRAAVQGEALRLDYELAWGDCPAGCIDGHVWSFLLNSDGTVTYLGSSGSPPPRQLP